MVVLLHLAVSCFRPQRSGAGRCLPCVRSTWRPRAGLADFRHYVEKHRPQCGARIVAYEPVNQHTEPELLAMARRYFQKYDLMAGTPTPL